LLIDLDGVLRHPESDATLAAQLWSEDRGTIDSEVAGIVAAYQESSAMLVD
jgi:hypothetical protein